MTPRCIRRYIRALMVLSGLLTACLGLGGVYSGCVYAVEGCREEYFDLKGAWYMHERAHPCAIANNEMCHIWQAEDAALWAWLEKHNARCPGAPERLIEDPRNHKYRQQPLQQHHQQAHPPQGTGAGAGKIQSYEQAIKLVEKYPIDNSRIRKGGSRLETRLVPNEQELLSVERQLTHGLSATNRSAPGKGVVQLYHLRDGTKVGIRDFSRSGGRTIEITPHDGGTKVKPVIRLHIK